MPRTFDAEFRRRVVELVRSCRSVASVAADLVLAEATVYRWKVQSRNRWSTAAFSTTTGAPLRTAESQSAPSLGLVEFPLSALGDHALWE
ncbi:MAG: hypothetical protein QOE89_2447 [Pseudonocardiales bacterium]|nr:hypothetical protein [Pseudonocardiales bacterium]